MTLFLNIVVDFLELNRLVKVKIIRFIGICLNHHFCVELPVILHIGHLCMLSLVKYSDILNWKYVTLRLSLHALCFVKKLYLVGSYLLRMF